MRYYWTKIRSDMAMAAELKRMHRAKPREIIVWGPPDADGKSTAVGTKVVFEGMSRRDLHGLAMGR